jgi:hypothetical protein
MDLAVPMRGLPQLLRVCRSIDFLRIVPLVCKVFDFYKVLDKFKLIRSLVLS